MKPLVDVRILKIELVDIAREFACGDNALVYIAQLEAALDDKTKQFRAFREARIGHDYITYSEELDTESEVLRKALNKALGAIDGEREPCPLCGAMFWAGSFGHNEDCLVYKKEKP